MVPAVILGSIDQTTTISWDPNINSHYLTIDVASDQSIVYDYKINSSYFTVNVTNLKSLMVNFTSTCSGSASMFHIGGFFLVKTHKTFYKYILNK